MLAFIRNGMFVYPNPSKCLSGYPNGRTMSSSKSRTPSDMHLTLFSVTIDDVDRTYRVASSPLDPNPSKAREIYFATKKFDYDESLLFSASVYRSFPLPPTPRPS
jgi:hypothetical protein